jgi:hypothetical protein
MEVREKLEDVLKGLSLTDEERLGAFFSLANEPHGTSSSNC